MTRENHTTPKTMQHDSRLIALRLWMRIQAVVWTLGLLIWPWLGWDAAASAYGICGLALVSYAALWFLLGAGWKLADYITLSRFVGILTMVAITGHLGEVTTSLWLGMVAMVLADLADGYCARRFGGSEQGAVLDMESDQFTTLCLAAVLYVVQGVPAWVLILPMYRYGFVVLASCWKMPIHDPKPCDGDNRRAKYLCAAMMGLLLLATFPTLPATARLVAVAMAVVAIAYSYLDDLRFLLRHRRAMPS